MSLDLYPSESEIKYSPIRYYYSNKKKDYIRSKTKYCDLFAKFTYEICSVKTKLCPVCSTHISRSKKKKYNQKHIKQGLLEK